LLPCWTINDANKDYYKRQTKREPVCSEVRRMFTGARSRIGESKSAVTDTAVRAFGTDTAAVLTGVLQVATHVNRLRVITQLRVRLYHITTYRSFVLETSTLSDNRHCYSLSNDSKKDLTWPTCRFHCHRSPVSIKLCLVLPPPFSFLVVTFKTQVFTGWGQLRLRLKGLD